MWGAYIKAFTYTGNAHRELNALRELKLHILQDITYSYDLDIICLAETWLNDTVSNNEILPIGYNIHRKDRLNQVGSGVLVAVKSTYTSCELCVSTDLEVVLVEIKINRSKKLLFIVCYRPPKADERFLTQLCALLNSLNLADYHGAFLMGDFNYPNIRWFDGSGFALAIDGEEANFVNILLDLNFFQFVNTPTRNDNILDLVFTNSPEIILNINSGPSYIDAGLPSDHYPVFFDIVMAPPSINKQESFRFDFSKVDFNLLNDRLELLPLSSGVNTAKSEELDSLWENWQDFVLSTMTLSSSASAL